MKKAMSLILAMLLAVSLVGCGGGNDTPPSENAEGNEQTEKPKITVWAEGSQNVSDTMTALIEAYNKREDATAEVSLQFLLSGTGDEGLGSRLAAAYKVGSTNEGFDMIASNTPNFLTWAYNAGSEDLFIDLDFSKLENWDSVQMPASDMEEKVMPYRGTTVMFTYDAERVTDVPETWDELTAWIKANPGRFAYSSSGGAATAFKQAAVYRFIDDPAARLSDDTKWTEQWDEGFAWLEEIHPYLYQSGGAVVYPNKNQGSLDLLINHEVDMIPAWADQTIQNIQQGMLPESTRMMQLKDGALAGQDECFTITSMCQNPDACYDFMDFVISPEGQKICLETMYAIPVIDPDNIDSDVKGAIEGLDTKEFAFMAIGALGDVFSERWERDILTLK